MFHKNQSLGIEFEVSTNFDRVDMLLRSQLDNLTVSHNSYRTRADNTFWHLKEDGSTAAEFCPPVIRTRKDWKEVENILDFLSANKVRVTSRDGLHIHLYAPKISRRKFLDSWLITESTINRLVPKRRFQGIYCVSYAAYTKNHKQDLTILNDHYSSISFAKWNARKTIEIRLASGTIDAKYTYAWAEFWAHYFKWIETHKNMLLLKGLNIRQLCAKFKVSKSSTTVLLKQYRF